MSLNSTASSSSSVSASAYPTYSPTRYSSASASASASVSPYTSVSASPSAYLSASVSPSSSLSPSSTASFVLLPQQIVASQVSLDGWIAIFSSIGVTLLCSIILSICYYRRFQKEKLQRLRLEQVEKRLSLQMATSRMSSIRDLTHNRV